MVMMESKKGMKRVMLDTCAETNVMTWSMVKELGIEMEKITANNSNLGSIDNNKTKIIGQVEVELNKREYLFQVIRGEISKDGKILIGSYVIKDWR